MPKHNDTSRNSGAKKGAEGPSKTRREQNAIAVRRYREKKRTEELKREAQFEVNEKRIQFLEQTVEKLAKELLPSNGK